jgi:hypothetical protein
VFERKKIKMKKLILLVTLNIFFAHLNAQNFTWAKAEGKFAYDYGYGIANDNSGNVYVAGKYEEDAIFSGTTLSCQGNHDIFVAQYSASGNLNWIRTAGGVLGDYAHSLACNKTSNVYIAGEIEGSNDLVSFQGTPITLTTKGDNDIFLASYDLNGNLLWAKSEGSSKSEKALGVSYDDAGNVVICGYFTDTTYFNGVMIPGNGNHDIFVAKYDATGNLLWVKHAGGPLRDEALSVKCDASGNIYVCGMHSNGFVCGSTTFSTVNTSSGYYMNAFIAKYASDGTLIWVKSEGGDYDDVAWSLTLDGAGKIYVTGEFNAYATFGGTGLTTSGEADIFVACYDNSGTVQWAVPAGGPLIDRARGIGTDGLHLFITGQYGGTASFGAGTLTAVDSSDIFVAELFNNGSFIWSSTAGGNADQPEYLGYESGNSICAEPSGTAYVTGSLLDNGSFGTNTISAYGRTDAFIAKMSTYVGMDEINDPLSLIHIYPNPGNGKINIVADNGFKKETEISVYNYLGELIYRTDPHSSSVSIDLSKKDKGIYFVQVASEKDLSIEKIVLQ